MNLDEKYEKLKDILHDMESTAIGFSGGVDSTLLLKVATDILDDKAQGIIASSFSLPERELDDAIRLGREIGAHVRVITSDEESNPQFVNNPLNRCYFCRSELFSKMVEIADNEGLNYIADGANIDDDSDYRPGKIAQKKYSVRSPLREAGLHKNEIRTLSKKLGLSTFDKPAYACLASRIPYGSKITPENLSIVDQAENYLMKLDFKTVRVRHYEKTARIEVGIEELERILDTVLREKIVKKFKNIGYVYVTVDLEGFRSGSMNDVLNGNKEYRVLNEHS